jgi:acetoin utilization deacetylase AcuC-like enzyme
MAVLLVTDPRFVDHDTGAHHPERPSRLGAVLDGIADAHLSDALVTVAPRLATAGELVAVHDPTVVGMIEELCAAGGGQLDPDTVVVPASWEAARLAAGAGLTAIEMLDARTVGASSIDAAFCAVRPPGHHATRAESMGFCLLNNVAVTAAHLVERGERVVIADFDAHHGNGTQDVFYGDDRVLFVSWHQWPLYPGTGRLDEVGSGAGAGYTINIPLPPGATAEHHRRAFDEVVAPAIERFDPTWLLISAGFDGHRADPLASLGLTAGDFADLVADLVASVAPGRVIVFLEGGYDLDALALSAAATVGVLVGEVVRPEAASSGGPGHTHVDQLIEFHQRLNS